jgi:hypothetical protein
MSVTDSSKEESCVITLLALREIHKDSRTSTFPKASNRLDWNNRVCKTSVSVYHHENWEERSQRGSKQSTKTLSERTKVNVRLHVEYSIHVWRFNLTFDSTLQNSVVCREILEASEASEWAEFIYILSAENCRDRKTVVDYHHMNTSIN